MIHSRIKWLHTEEDTTTKQKKIRSHQTISEKNCRDLSTWIITRKRKHEGFDRSLPKVKLCWNRPKERCCSRPKKRSREAVLRSRLCKGQTRAGRGSLLWKGLRKRSSKDQSGAGRGRVLERVTEEGSTCAEGSDASRKYVTRVGSCWRLRLLLGSCHTCGCGYSFKFVWRRDRRGV